MAMDLTHEESPLKKVFHCLKATFQDSEIKELKIVLAIFYIILIYKTKKYIL